MQRPPRTDVPGLPSRAGAGVSDQQATVTAEPGVTWARLAFERLDRLPADHINYAERSAGRGRIESRDKPVIGAYGGDFFGVFVALAQAAAGGALPQPTPAGEPASRGVEQHPIACIHKNRSGWTRLL